jgi:hypothetical protein
MIDEHIELDDRSKVGDRSRGHSLPVLACPSKCGTTAISAETLARLLNGELSPPEGYSVQLVDCRYPFEYEGGHIRNAVNAWRHEIVHERFFEPTAVARSDIPTPDCNTILIFYCEYSQERGPRM